MLTFFEDKKKKVLYKKKSSTDSIYSSILKINTLSYVRRMLKDHLS